MVGRGGDAFIEEALVDYEESFLYRVEMAINIKDPETETLVRAVSERCKLGLTELIRVAVKAFSETVTTDHPSVDDRRRRIQAIRARTRRYKVLDDRSAEQILGYDDSGAPN